MAVNLKPSEYVLSLAAPGTRLETVGGKGASLARLAAAGLPVPDGFHATTAVYRQIVATNDLQPCNLAALEGADPTQPATLETTSQTTQALFAQAHIPEDIAGAIAQTYHELPGDNPVAAVRSSATALDQPGRGGRLRRQYRDPLSQWSGYRANWLFCQPSVGETRSAAQITIHNGSAAATGFVVFLCGGNGC